MSALIATLHQRPTLRSAVRFALVGLTGTLLDLGLFTTFYYVIGMAAVTANIVSYSAGIVNNYLLNRAWTFAGRPRARVAGQFAQFAAVSMTALALNTLIVALLAPEVGGLAAKLLASAAGLAWNFLGNHFWTFGRR
jgi:dolichol-phosphate mannosyltransferase